MSDGDVTSKTLSGILEAARLQGAKWIDPMRSGALRGPFLVYRDSKLHPGSYASAAIVGDDEDQWWHLEGWIFQGVGLPKDARLIAWCYACNARATGTRDRTLDAEGAVLPACSRHADAEPSS